MGLLSGKTHVDYYQGNDLGNYQFTSLETIIAQFQIAYVGEDKIISKVKQQDVQFFAMRALQEFSFDTFKSIKSQQIDLPPSLTMSLPHDYVNYTKISSVDSSGIKHPLYPTKHTSNPFQILQEDDGSYSFPEEAEEVVNGNFDDSVATGGTYFGNAWNYSPSAASSGNTVAALGNDNSFGPDGSPAANFSFRTRNTHPVGGPTHWGHTMYLYQELDVSDKTHVDLSADGKPVSLAYNDATITNAPGIIRIGLSTNKPDTNTRIGGNATRTYNTLKTYFDLSTNNPAENNHISQPSYIEWRSDADSDGNGVTDDGVYVSKYLQYIDVSNHDKVYISIIVWQGFNQTNPSTTLTSTSKVDNVSLVNTFASEYLQSPSANKYESSTWKSYKSLTPSENNNDDYEDNHYEHMQGKRYGLEPSHAQINGSFYIDERFGKIHFSSNISGKTVILDYISDGIGTEGEMQVHKFAEEAMYKHIAYAILSSSSSPIHQQLAPRFKKERFAETRKAKLRLSNIKLEEITQILRGKSKQIKH